MDILSRLFDEMHLQRVQYISVQASGEWQLKQPCQNYLTFIVVISGELILNYADQVQTITANNMIMMTSQASYQCQSNHELSRSTIKHYIPEHKANQINLVIDDTSSETKATQPSSADNKQVKFIIVRSQFDTDMARPLLSSLPDTLPPPSLQHSAYNEVVRIGLQFFQLEISLQRPGKTTMLARLASMLMIECIREYVEQLESVLIDNDQIKSDAKRVQNRLSWTDNPWEITTEPKSEPKSLNSDSMDSSTFNTLENSGNWLMALKDPYLSKTLYLMHSYPAESWTLQQLAKESGLSRSVLSERFKQLVGITPQAYFNHHRLRLAARFLRQEQYSISKISELVGYASDHSFSGAFKRRYGQSPSHYRKSFKQS